MPSPLGFLWAGIVEEIGGRWSITSVKHWLSACMVAITSAIWALKSDVRLLERLVICLVILVRSVVTSVLINRCYSFEVLIVFADDGLHRFYTDYIC